MHVIDSIRFLFASSSLFFVWYVFRRLHARLLARKHSCAHSCVATRTQIHTLWFRLCAPPRLWCPRPIIKSDFSYVFGLLLSTITINITLTASSIYQALDQIDAEITTCIVYTHIHFIGLCCCCLNQMNRRNKPTQGEESKYIQKQTEWTSERASEWASESKMWQKPLKRKH